MPIKVVNISSIECDKLLALHESHFCELKATEVAPSKLTGALAALSNAEGGEVYIGVKEDKTTRTNLWVGFRVAEDANGHIQTFEDLFPLGEGYSYTFLKSDKNPGLILKVEVSKSRDVKYASDRKVYVRRSAQNLPINGEEGLIRLRRNKGLVSFETEPVRADLHLITNSTVILSFMLEVVPTAEPESWLRKQQVIQGDKPTVAGVVLFAEDHKQLCRSDAEIKFIVIRRPLWRVRGRRLMVSLCQLKATRTRRFVTP